MPTVIDLFSGCGGLSLGASRAGFAVSGSVEIDQFALETHVRNFPNTVHVAEDVASLTGRRVLQLVGLKAGQLDGLIGGPPCQGFSTIGRRDLGDERNNLFAHFFRLVAELRPAFFLAENVPGILNQKYDQLRTDALGQVPKNYRVLSPIKVRANQFGAPTTRTRIFFIGYDPKRFRSDISETDFLPKDGIGLITVGVALHGLPKKINPEWQTAESGWRPVKVSIENSFFENVVNNAPSGIGDRMSMDRYFETGRVSGCLGTQHTPEVVQRFLEVLPGQADPISKAMRLHRDGFCPTLRAGTSKERGSYQAVRPIHFAEPRVITPREAARLQGFPDWFVFHETKWHSFRQIGNSVSPLVAEALLSKIRVSMR